MNLNFLAIILGVLAAYVFNAIWFGPKTFYPVWARALGRNIPAESERDTSAKNSVRLFGGTFAGQFATGIVLAIIIGLIDNADALTGAGVGLGVGVIAAGASLGHRLFAFQGFKVWFIEVSADVIGLVLMGLIIGAF